MFAGLFPVLCLFRPLRRALLPFVALAAGVTSAQTTDKPPEAQRYVDRVIDPAAAAVDEKIDSSAQDEDRLLGRRSNTLKMSLGLSNQLTGAQRIDNAVEYSFQRETLDYGIFDFTAAGYASRESDIPSFAGLSGVAKTAGERFALTQTRFSYNENTVMDNALGSIYSIGSGLVSRSFRNSLSSSAINGFTSRVNYAPTATEITVTHGEIGQFFGTGAASFRRTNGTLSGASIDRRFDSGLSGGLQVWSVSGAASVHDHTSVSGALTYSPNGSPHKFGLRGIADSHGKTALWFDGEFRDGGGMHRYGFSRFEQGVTWADYPVASGVQSAYWRYDSRGLSRLYSVGVDYSESNYARDPSQPFSRSAVLFGSINERIDRTTNIGATANLRSTFTQQPQTPSSDSSSSTLNRVDGFLFGSKSLPIGVSRLQVNYGKDLQGGADSTFGLQWDQEFTRLALATSASHSRDTSSTGTSVRNSLAVMFRGISLLNLYLTGGANAYRLTSDSRPAETGFQANVYARWQINRFWSVTGSLSMRHVINASPSAPGVPEAQNEQILLVTLRYDDVKGTPYYTGSTAGPTASSRIIGQVFFDENGDGIAQAGENPASGVVVVLDNGYRAQTDAQGRFEFAPVRPGRHTVSIQVDRLPLPWGLLDEAPASVVAPVRDFVEVRFPLVKLRP